MNTPLIPSFYSMAKKGKSEQPGDQIVTVRMDQTTLEKIEKVGQRRGIRSKSDRIRYLLSLGDQADRGLFPQPQPLPTK